MTLPLTDQFLWKIFNLTQNASKISDYFAFRHWREVVDLELFMMRREKRRKTSWAEFYRLVSYLKKNGYIQIRNFKKTKGVMLTAKGVNKATQFQWKIGEKERRRDGKWQMVIFDIPEKKKKIREMVRSALNSIGYQRLQDSVWVCPYEVEKSTESAIRSYEADPYVKIFLIEKINI